MSTSESVIYIRFRKRVTLPRGEPIRLEQVAHVMTETGPARALQRLIVFEPQEHDGSLVLIDIMSVISRIRRIMPRVQIELFGEPHALVELVSGRHRPKLLLVIPVWLLLFIGSGLAIMNFHADVSMPEVHRRIYELITGGRSEHPYWLQIPYSIGIGIGMVLFFNHLFKKKFNDEPSPLEVEMFMYQENMNQYVITEEYGKLHSREDVTPDVERGG